MNEDLNKRAGQLLAKLDLEDKRREIKTLEAESALPEFWQDQKRATAKMKQLASLKKELEEGEMLELLMSEGRNDDLARELNRLEFALYLSGDYDKGDAIFAIHAGQGGTEAMDWTAMLYRMYSRYIEKKGWQKDEIDFTPGDEAGIKSVISNVSGRYAYGFLKAEAGVHRLVRQSPFNADNLRQTSFALVEAFPVIEETEEVEISQDDLEWDFYRSGGKGGQNVNKVSTAVRLRHIPSGIVVVSQGQRYQGQNREYALKVLRAKLWAKQEEEEKKKRSELKGQYKTPGWGNQIRSYVLHPYHLVRDLRTDHQINTTEKVLDGDIDDFILAYLKKVS